MQYAVSRLDSQQVEAIDRPTSAFKSEVQVMNQAPPRVSD